MAGEVELDEEDEETTVTLPSAQAGELQATTAILTTTREKHLCAVIAARFFA